MNESSAAENQLQRELAYYKKQLDQISGESIKHDFVLSSLRRELNQKKAAFSILSSLQTYFSVATPLDLIFEETLKAISTQLNMDRSVVLVPSPLSNKFQVYRWYGYPHDQITAPASKEVEIPISFCSTGKFILVNKSITPDETAHRIQQNLVMKYFIGVPVLLNEQAIAFIVCGRQFEKVPFIPPLNIGDADTLMAIASLVSTICQDKKIIELKLQKAEVERQKEAISEQRDELDRALCELRNTQALLIQREKMASLGELTAGIAHEIQNPLNFVNNFSEINKELIDEINNELLVNNCEEALAILRDLRENEQKITYHGKRADAIVKGMSQHSRASTGTKEWTDINALVEEYFKLSYHGFRAKDKSFNASMQTHFQQEALKINIVPQDIGRVLLNLFNNAFYAVNEEKKQARNGYDPTVSVCTLKVDGHVEIHVQDNGTGIPQKVVDKIFQPFFTTKPTGQGTGLGLSLSYEIIKAHGGELKMGTREREGSLFVVRLPA